MKLKDFARRFWRDFEALAYALDYDEREDIEARIKRLEANGQLQLARLLSLSEEVQALSEHVPRPAGSRS